MWAIKSVKISLTLIRCGKERNADLCPEYYIETLINSFDNPYAEFVFNFRTQGTYIFYSGLSEIIWSPRDHSAN